MIIQNSKGETVNEQRPLPTQDPGGNASEPFSGNTNTTHVFVNPMRYFVITNDDATADLTFTIGGNTFTVKAGEVFEEKFAAFTQVTVTTTVAFRAYGRD